MIKILLADDQYLILEAMKAILEQEPEIEIVGTATDGKSAIEQTVKLRPDLVVIDIEMPKMNGIAATKYICEYMPDTKVIVLTSHNKQSYIDRALQAGASGYLLKDTLIQDLKQTIHSLYAGCSYVETDILIQTPDRIQAANIPKYKEKVTYLKKYRKSIYRPVTKQKSRVIEQKVNSFLSRNSVDSKITKASLTPIFESSTQEILKLDRQPTQKRKIYTAPQFNRRSYLKRIIWMLIAIASFVLSVLIF